MKKVLAVVLMLFIVFSMGLVACDNDEKAKDYSKFSFTDKSWSREGSHDLETIRFGADGSFTYSCACGNPVNDADLCDGYNYDDKSKTITLECEETTDEMITVIKIVKCDDKELQLDFDGDIRTFNKQ